MKGVDGGYKLTELFFGRGGSADAIVNVAAVEFRFWAVVLTKKLMFDKTYKKIGVAGSHFSTHGHAISLFEKQLSVSTSSARRSSVSELGDFSSISPSSEQLEEL